jgi:dTMP kinase
MSARLIVIEGLDGSGKATQAALLAEGLRAQGEKVREISFPDYKSRSSQLVQMYLAGEVGPLEEVNVYAASGFYSLDRYISYQTSWKEDYAGGGVIVADRYTTSNFCHQMGRLSRAQWASYSRWLTEYEYERLGLPVPDLVVYLDMHPEASRRLIELRSSQTDRKKPA